MPVPNDNPASGFAVLVRIVAPASVALTDTIDGQFQEASGIDARMVLQEEEAGGLNSFAHRSPRVTMAANLVLKRGLVTRQSALADWAAQSLGAALGAAITTRTIILSLVGHDGKNLTS